MEKMQTQPTEFLQELISTMTNPSHPLEMRHGCGVILKRALDMPVSIRIPLLFIF